MGSHRQTTAMDHPRISPDNCRRRRKSTVFSTNPILRILIVCGLACNLQIGVDFLKNETYMAFENDTGPEMISRAISAAVSRVDVPADASNAPDRYILRNTTSFCLLTKDDGMILNEWIAYHYHVLNMRQLIVAVDPLSETSPEPILQKWEELFGMSIEVWGDEDFMPASFLRGEY
eukprot:scaffold19736_cov127-Cylindrotheca_fusiformis.AAC.2